MNWTTALAFVIAPAVVPLGLYVYVSASNSPAEISRVGITYSFMLTACYVLAVIVGIPMHRFMRTYNQNRLRHYLLGGSLIGGVPGLTLFIAGLPNLSARIAVPIISGALVGAFSAAVFWLIGIAGSNKTMEPTR
jgi:drug/metabolite transporter (DMT)-like permease